MFIGCICDSKGYKKEGFMSVTTVLVWNESDVIPNKDDYYLVWSSEFTLPIQTLHYDVFLNRWTLDDEVFVPIKSFYWTNFLFNSNI